MRQFRSLLTLCTFLGVISLAHDSRAANCTTTNVQGGGANWTATIWKTNGTGSGAAPIPGNTYQCLQGPNPAAGNNQNETRIRNPVTAGQPAIITFPGDSLTLTTNTEIRFKRIAANNVPICNFPGVGGNPGLILNGGILNAGDDAIFPITGQMRVDSQSYICPGDNDGAGALAARAFTIGAEITGSGSLVIFEAMTNNPQQITSANNTYSGLWLVKAGRLLGAATDSLGTNSSFVMDPSYVLPVPPFSSTAPVVDVAGPAVLEPNYDMNSAGTLTLVNGGKVRLHQSLTFTAVTIEGNPLSPGTHYYSELITNHPNNFDPGGYGAITVQPYGPPPTVPPTVITSPDPQLLYAGATAHFPVVAWGPGTVFYHWRKGGTELTDGGNIAGALTPLLTVSGVSAADEANYDVVVANSYGSVTSSVAPLTLVAPSGELYESAVIAAGASAFYQLNETSDPASGNVTAYDYAGGFNGLYGAGVQNGHFNYNIAGPTAASGFAGFAAANKAAQFANNVGNALIPVRPWNFNTNALTITAWVNPNGLQVPNEALVFCRGGGTVAGLNYTANLDNGGNPTLGYTWNNEWETYSWNSGLAAPAGQWSFVALVVTPASATIHVMNTNGLLSASRSYSHVVQSSSGTTLIGDDSADGGNGARVFNGTIDDVAVFNRALSQGELIGLYTNASGVALYPPTIALQPTNETWYAGQTAIFAVSCGGSEPLAYQWQASPPSMGTYTNMADGGKTFGSTTPTLVINNIGPENALDYILTLSNPGGSVTSVVANLSVLATSPAENITMINQQGNNLDWENGPDWSDGLAASVSAASKPGSTYQILPPGRMRSPINPRTAIFPGDLITLEGTGVWNVNPPTNATISEIRFKQPNPGTVIFKKLIMNGGQIDAGNDGIITVGGQIEIRKNAPFNNDSANDRGYQIDAWLTGTNTIEYHGYNLTVFMPNYRNPLNITGTSNTFSGKWNIVTGVLLGTGTNSLGTNDILIGTNGVLETTYDVNNPSGNLVLSGKMYLHQNDTFRSVIVNGLALAPGTYSFAQLNSTYPATFPATWTPQTGATNFSSGSGSLTVLVQAGPAITSQPQSQTLYAQQTANFRVTAVGNPPLYYRWRAGPAGSGIFTNLTDGGKFSGCTTTNLTISNIAANNAGDYVVLVTNAVGSVTSVVATLTVLPVSPPENITMSVQQAQGNDWNTGADWSDGLPASTSAVSKPGSTYEVLPGARLRTPASAANSIFPGNLLTVDGDGVYVNNGTPTIGEIRFKHANPGTNFFKKLVMNGGQLDSGDNGLCVIAGEMNVLGNTPIYADSAAGQDRPYQIDAWLTGNGSIEYHAWDASFSGNLNITGTTNTFSGKWNIVQGVLLGSGVNSLGTNDITIGADGALETLYDVGNTNGNLVLDGQMFLHQNDTFHSLLVGGAPVAPGVYPFATLTANYPTHFPATWPQQMGSPVSVGSGSITVLALPVVNRPTLQIEVGAGQMTLSWPTGFWLIEASEVTGPWTTNTTATSPFVVTPTEARKFFGLQPQ